MYTRQGATKSRTRVYIDFLLVYIDLHKIFTSQENRSCFAGIHEVYMYFFTLFWHIYLMYPDIFWAHVYHGKPHVYHSCNRCGPACRPCIPGSPCIPRGPMYTLRAQHGRMGVASLPGSFWRCIPGAFEVSFANPHVTHMCSMHTKCTSVYILLFMYTLVCRRICMY